MGPSQLRVISLQKCKVQIGFNQESIFPKCAAICNSMLQLLLHDSQISGFDAASDRATKVELVRQISSFGSYKQSSYDQNRLYFLPFASRRRKYETAKSPKSIPIVEIFTAKWSFEQIFYYPSILGSVQIKFMFHVCN